MMKLVGYGIVIVFLRVALLGMVRMDVIIYICMTFVARIEWYRNLCFFIYFFDDCITWLDNEAVGVG